MHELSWVWSYVGIPFLSHGRDERGVDCWGLVKLVCEREFKLRLPDFTPAYHDALKADQATAAYQVGHGQLCPLRIPAADVRTGDLVVIRYRGVPCHVGIALGASLVLHADVRAGVVVENVTAARMVNRIEGYYRVG